MRAVKTCNVNVANFCHKSRIRVSLVAVKVARVRLPSRVGLLNFSIGEKAPVEKRTCNPSLINYDNAGRSMSFTNELVSVKTNAGTLFKVVRVLLTRFSELLCNSWYATGICLS